MRARELSEAFLYVLDPRVHKGPLIQILKKYFQFYVDKILWQSCGKIQFCDVAVTNEQQRYLNIKLAIV